MWEGQILMEPAAWWSALDTPLVIRILQNFVRRPDFKARLNVKLLERAVFSDAHTQEVKVGKTKVIYDSGTPPVSTSKLANANVGALPSASTYLSVSTLFGCKSWQLYHGLKHGKHKDLSSKVTAPDKRSPGQMFENVKIWSDDASEHDKVVMKYHKYYNTPEAITKWNKLRKAGSPTFEQLVVTRGFDPNFFLVRHSPAHALTIQLGKSAVCTHPSSQLLHACGGCAHASCAHLVIAIIANC